MTDPRTLLGPVLAAAVEALVAERIGDALADLERAAEPWPAFMSVPTVARYLDVNEERVRHLLAAGTLPRVQEGPGCRVFVARSDADALMAEWREEVRPRRS